MKFLQANRIAADGTPRSAASHLGLCCLPMSHKGTPGVNELVFTLTIQILKTLKIIQFFPFLFKVLEVCKVILYVQLSLALCFCFIFTLSNRNMVIYW